MIFDTTEKYIIQIPRIIKILKLHVFLNQKRICFKLLEQDLAIVKLMNVEHYQLEKTVVVWMAFEQVEG